VSSEVTRGAATDATEATTDAVGLERELERLRAELDAERRRTRDELAFARRVQLNLMPVEPPAVEGWEIAAAYHPAREVGGDFFDLYPLPAQPSTLGFVVADVTGKGITAALMMAFTRAVLRSAAYNGSGPADALQRTNRVLVREARTGLFLTAFVGWLDTRSGRLAWASAGHDPPLLVRTGDDRQVTTLDAAGELLGAFDELHMADRTTDLQPGDVLLVPTDGAAEARNPDGEFFGEQGVASLVAATAPDGARAVVRAIEAALDRFRGDATPADDVTLLGISRAPRVGSA
jgi:serine phosphatase RsbU (regulator of sigma subunit)